MQLAVQGATKSALPSATTWLFNKHIMHFSQPRNWLLNESHNRLFLQPQIGWSMITQKAFQSATQLAVQ